jgi:hypothetical protein
VPQALQAYSRLMTEPDHEEAPHQGDELWGGSRSKGRSRGLFALLVIGLMLLGALVGGLIGYYSYKPDPGCYVLCGAGLDVMVDAFWGGLIGLVAGLIAAIVLVVARRARAEVLRR